MLLKVERSERGVVYRVEPLAAGGSLGGVGDALSSSASQKARHPAGDAVTSVLLQHLQRGADRKL